MNDSISTKSHRTIALPVPCLPGPADVRFRSKADMCSDVARRRRRSIFTSCVNRIFGRQPGQERKLSLQEAMIAVSARPGMPLSIPEDVGGHCCATIWHSKGYVEGNVVMANRTVESLWRWSDSGKWPIVCDATSCSLGLTSEIVEYLTPENRERYAQLKIFNSVAWAHDQLLRKLKSVTRPHRPLCIQLFDQSPQAWEQATCARGCDGQRGSDAGRCWMLRLCRRSWLSSYRTHSVGDSRGGGGGLRTQVRCLSWQQSHL